MSTLLRTRAAFWAGAGILALAGAATSIAAAGQGKQAQDSPPDSNTSGIVAEQSVVADMPLLESAPSETTTEDAGVTAKSETGPRRPRGLASLRPTWAAAKSPTRAM